MTDDAPTIAERACDWLRPGDAEALRQRVAKHGQPVSARTDPRDWREELREELLDAAWYLEAHAMRGPHDSLITGHLRTARQHIMAALSAVHRMGGVR
jgi:hypothetical protein